MHTDIPTLLAKLTLEEKVALVCGRDEWTTVPIDRLGIPAVWVADGPHGVRRSPLSSTGGYGDQLPATCLPTASALAASWDTKLLEEAGHLLGDECRYLGVNVLLGPGANIKRSPLGGRNFEYLSEDPLLAGELAAAYIRGVQSRGVGTSLKHFACNSQETRRMIVDSLPDERTLHEIYLENFRIAVAKGDPWTVMAAYNPVNGTDATANKDLLDEILKKQWGYAGVVVSDWQAVYERAPTLVAGLDLEMPGNNGFNNAAVLAAVKNGEVTIEQLDAAVRRVLELVQRAHADSPQSIPFPPRTGFELPSLPAAVAESHHNQARKIAAACSVLLKNEAGALPLDLSAYKRIALIGAFAKHPRFQGNGSSEVKPTRVDSLLASLSEAIPAGAELRFEEGFLLEPQTSAETVQKGLLAFEKAMECARWADLVLIHSGLPQWIESEGVDRTNLELPQEQNRLISGVAALGKKTVVVLTNGTAVTMPWIEDVDAVLETWLAGQAGGSGIADVLLGRAEPAGRLAETFPLRIEDTPSFFDLPSRDLRLAYSEGIFVGYRWYDTRKLDVLFPFGHGLSYSTFEYSDVRVANSGPDGQGLQVCCTVRNTGSRSATEVVQVYLSALDPDMPRPGKELKAFAKLFLESGQSRELVFDLEPHALEFYHPRYHLWYRQSGTYEVLIGASSVDIRVRQSISYRSTQKISPCYDERTCIRDWLRFPEYRRRTLEVIKPFFDSAPGLVVGEYENFNVPNGFFVDMPIIKYVRLSGGAVSRAAIDGLVSWAAGVPVSI